MKTIKFPLIFILFQIATFVFQELSGHFLYFWAIKPLSIEGLAGILFTPFVHSGIEHIVSNICAEVFLFYIFFTLYKNHKYFIFFSGYILTGLIVWIIGRNVYHAGASGIVFYLISLILFTGIFKKEKSALALSLIILLIYSGSFYSILPSKENISWESHLAGALSGLASAIFFRNIKTDEKAETEEPENNSPSDNTGGNININYSCSKKK